MFDKMKNYARLNNVLKEMGFSEDQRLAIRKFMKKIKIYMGEKE